MTSTTGRRRRGPRRAFTKDEVLDAAQQLLDEGGVEAASVRGIAKKLAVAPNTIYTYFPDRAAILEALVERLLGGIDHDVFADDRRSWRHRVEAVAVELHAQLASHPGAVGVIVGDPLSGPHALALNEHTRKLFTDAGLDQADAARAAHVLIVYILGSLALEVVHPGSLPLAPGRSTTRTAAEAHGPRQPPLQRVADLDHPGDETAAERYLWGLHRVLDGLTIGTGEPRS